MSTAVEEQKAPKKAKKVKEVSAADFPVRQPERLIQPPLGDSLEHPSTEIESVDEGALKQDRLEALKFEEEPVTIYIQSGTEKFDAKFAEAWVNGKGIEILLNGKWTEVKGIPKGYPVTIKRKYAGALALSFTERVTTEVIMPENPGDDVTNAVNLQLTRNLPFTLLHPTEKDLLWFQRIMGYTA